MMQQPPLQFLVVGNGASERRIACLVEPRPSSDGPGLMWLPGFKSEMTSTKAAAIAALADRHGWPMTRFDYSGHGQSGGRFEDGSLSRWLDEARAVFTSLTRGPQIVIGSSMGGYIALLLLRQLMDEAAVEARRVVALVLIAPAWDMTERLMWGRFSEAMKRDVMESGVYLRPSHYGDGPYAITRGLIEDGRRHLIGDRPFNPGRPVHILHGLQDPDVPWEHTLDLVAHLDGDWTRVEAVPDGDHRLSTPRDLELLARTIETAAADAKR